ncbi:MAG: UDP-N-acetylmuramoyl-tripeptide--D-alanyl-D-alanine ligase [Candidatus Tectomicrobia bacterium]|uniref:UDP-N-acetylmuramoyl-tripeptide--D-alanyl-D-alanine ligase n=1 Tax=Tectimicrobiota bacterium TaxID=2528274 RepID=A0A932FYE7_UNCTE|nr:UDP-N-acetylmuramoyl-tripeptide--D-alanyl-D-alanine ligase [Candidatus Tectomicrobia bacterium]
MEGLTLGEIAYITGGKILQGREDLPVEGISTDSRTVQPGELFWVLTGERFDGHHFIHEALEKGAAGVILSRPEDFPAGPENGPPSRAAGALPACLWVPDTLKALQELAHAYRKRFDIPVVAITGSNGKTTTKELTASVLAQHFKVWKTQGNFNNLIGLPLTLLGLSAHHQALVVEMGMSRPGEIARLCQIAAPTLGVLTNIGTAHLEFLGSVEAIQRAKGELVQALQADHLLVINADDLRVVELGQGFAGRTLSFGIHTRADLQAREVQELGLAGTRFRLRIGEEEVPIHLPLVGLHNVYNALAAAAVGHGLSVGLSEIREALEGFSGIKMRMQPHRLWNEVILINDCYNANPNSMKAAIRTLARLDPPGGRSFLVMGDMLELGPRGEALHREIGRFVVEQKIDILITVGERARLAAEEAMGLGMNGDRVQICSSHEEGARALLARLKEGDRVLVKGSRGLAMERLIHQVLGHQG